MNSDWKRSRNNNPYLKIKNHIIVLYENKHDYSRAYNMQKNGTWKYSIDSVFCPETFGTKEEAKLAAFEALERMT